MDVKRQRIVAIGGGGFQMEGSASPIDDHLVTLTGQARPRVCLLPTPSGDRPDYIEAFHEAYAARGCETSHVAFFQREPQPGAIALPDLETHFWTQDMIFVSGGNMRAAFAVWREWRVDALLAKALERGVLLAGMSAGAMCWFEWALTDTYWSSGYRPVPALAFVNGGCRVHYDDTPDQRGRLHAALLAGAVPPTVAIADGAAVLYEDGVVARVVTWQPGAAAYHVDLQGSVVQETAYPHESLV